MKNTWKMACVVSTALCLLTVTQAMGQATQKRNQDNAVERTPASQQKVCLASKVTKMMVKDKGNQPIGQIQDLVIDESGQVQYLAIAAQGHAGTSNRSQPERTPGARTDKQPGDQARNPVGNQTAKLTLVPFDAVQFHEGENEAQNYASLNIDQDRFTQAPAFTSQQLTAQAQQAQWMSQVDQFFEREKNGAARPDLNNPDRNEKNNKQPNRNE